MLANGAKLGYKAEKGTASYTDLPGLKEIPDWGSDPEKVDNTCLTDAYKPVSYTHLDVYKRQSRKLWNNRKRFLEMSRIRRRTTVALQRMI